MSEFTQKVSMHRGVGNVGWKYQIKADPRKSRIFQEENYPNKILKGRKRGAQEMPKYFQQSLEVKYWLLLIEQF